MESIPKFPGNPRTEIFAKNRCLEVTLFLIVKTLTSLAQLGYFLYYFNSLVFYRCDASILFCNEKAFYAP